MLCQRAADRAARWLGSPRQVARVGGTLPKDLASPGASPRASRPRRAPVGASGAKSGACGARRGRRARARAAAAARAEGLGVGVRQQLWRCRSRRRGARGATLKTPPRPEAHSHPHISPRVRWVGAGPRGGAAAALAKQTRQPAHCTANGHAGRCARLERPTHARLAALPVSHACGACAPLEPLASGGSTCRHGRKSKKRSVCFRSQISAPSARRRGSVAWRAASPPPWLPPRSWPRRRRRPWTRPRPCARATPSCRCATWRSAACRRRRRPWLPRSLPARPPTHPHTRTAACQRPRRGSSRKSTGTARGARTKH